MYTVFMMQKQEGYLEIWIYDWLEIDFSNDPIAKGFDQLSPLMRQPFSPHQSGQVVFDMTQVQVVKSGYKRAICCLGKERCYNFAN